MRLRDLKKLVDDLIAGGDGGGAALLTDTITSQVVGHGAGPVLGDELELGYGKLYVVHHTIATMPKAITSGSVFAGPYTPDASKVEVLNGPGVLQYLYDNGSLPELDGGAFGKGFNDEPSPVGGSWLLTTNDVGATIQQRFINTGAADVTFLNSALTVREL